ncbi:MAG TPA: hypothetical protein VML55_03155, partial [Planctomycetaceae bacterium]|nr:hypothetical protein [Planctomycetaceae bacterium]
MARRARLASGAATLAAVSTLLMLLMFERRPNLAHEEDGQPAVLRTVPVVENAVQLRIELARQDQQQRVWDGEVSTSEGRVLGVEILRASMNSTVEGATFQVRARRAGQAARRPQQRRNLLSAVLHVSLDAPPTASVTVKTSRGEFSFRPADLTAGEAVAFLDGNASVEREEPSLKLTGPNTEDDHPALARAADGTIWLAYVEYQPGSPIIMPQVANRRFDTLEPEGHGDQIKLGWFDGKQWQLGVNVTGEGRDVWRPTVAVDGHGNVVVAWAEKVEDDWDVFFRTYAAPREGRAERHWSETKRIAHPGGSDFNVVSAVDADGKVWFAWQSWNRDNFDIRVATIEGGEEEELAGIANSSANEWCPAIAADSKGHVYVAWDTYDRGNYDVRLQQFGRGVPDEIDETLVAHSPRFEARVHLACDAANRVWIAYEEGDVLWGKDYQGNTPQRVGIGENPGYGLYVDRTVRVKCLADGQLQEPAAGLDAAFRDSTLQRNKSVPRLAVDEAGGVWLAFRHHPLSGGNGETWHSYAMRYEGDGWSEPRELPNSSNLLDNRPALVAFGKGILAVHSTDRRTRTQDRDQDDLYATRLAPVDDVGQPELKTAAAREIDEPQPVHANEVEDVARLRAARVPHGERELRLLRGEFHRHTEYTAHRDQDGLLEDSLRYALDAGRLDWMGNGDHDNGNGHEYMWWQIQKKFDLVHNPPQFVAAMTYERSVRYPSGHRNVMFPRRGIRPLPRLSNQQPI